jgi:DNA-binding CsgD family transcriptional regulator
MADRDEQERLLAAGQAYVQSRRELASEILIARSRGLTYAQIAEALGFSTHALRQLVRASPVAEDEEPPP